MIHSASTWILGYLLNSLWQVPLLFATGWLMTRLPGATAPAFQQRIWLGIVALEVSLPACSMLPTNWLKEFLFWPGHVDAGQAGRVTVQLGTGMTQGRVLVSSGFAAAIVALYGTVCLYFVARFLWRCGKLRVLRREAVPLQLTPEAAAVWAECASRLEVPAALGVSDYISGPVTVGASRPLLLLPPGMMERLNSTDLRAVLAHEVAHILHQDFRKNVALEVLTLPIAFHPFFWLSRAHVEAAREMICDAFAGGIVGPRNYANSLLRLAALIVSPAPAQLPHAIGFVEANMLERRLMKLNEKQANLKGFRRIAVIAGCTGFALATCGTALALRLEPAFVGAVAAGGQQSQSLPKVSAGVMAGNVDKKVTPIYPEAAKSAKIQGAVLMHAVIDKDGTIANLEIISGPAELQQSALDAVRQWTYKPYLLNGEPTAVETTITVNYSIGT